MIKWAIYYEHVRRDFIELRENYPFSNLTIPPTVKPSLASITVVAACKNLIDAVQGHPEDFIGEYSKKLLLTIPNDYWTIGCQVYGGGWIDTTLFPNKDVHFFHDEGKLVRTEHGLHMCVGTPESFSKMKNVILESVRTAENMLIAYERVQSGVSKELYLKAYSHGEEGKKEFAKDTRRYIPNKGGE